MGVPSVVVRESSERPEAFDTGNVIITGIDSQQIMRAIHIVRKQYEDGIKFRTPIDYMDTNVSDKIVRLIAGLNRIILNKKYYISK